MAEASSYSKAPLQDTVPSAPPVDEPLPHDPPPPYEAIDYGAPKGYQPVPGVPPVHSPPVAVSQPQAPIAVVVHQQPVAPVVVQQQPVGAASTVVVAQALGPGVCTVCRKGKIKSTRTMCTYLCCLLLCFWGIIPGLIVFCCCCQEAKCTHCGYTP